MSQEDAIHLKMQSRFEELWRGGDCWNFEGSAYEQARFRRQLALVDDRRYLNVLEIGCGSGCFTRLLAPISERIVALDIAPSAIERAVKNNADGRPIDFRVAISCSTTPGPKDRGTSW